ncbi:MAG: hypothetical protein MUF38_12340 [Anaerolineae bacterium]|jgi:hypothetical protein|nr:hypothetical protein [Anaerolineae bacterium]
MSHTRWGTALVLALILGLLSAGGTAAQSDQIPQPPALLAYACNFDRGANRLHVQAVFQSDVPGPVIGAYELTVTPAGSASPLDTDAVTVIRANPRPPLQMILLFDTTDTVPVTETAQAVIDGLLPGLQAADQVALITFDENVSLPTPFFTDKGALADQFLRGIGVGRGDNRVYNAMQSALESFPFSDRTRRVIVLVGDSGRRDDPQVAESEVAALAERLKIQVYPVVFNLRDNPDVEALLDISAASRGFQFLYRERNTTRQAVQTTITTYLQQLVRGLDSEIEIAIDPTGIQPTADNQINLTLTAKGPALDSYTLTDQIVCPYQAPASAIRFVTALDDTPITGQIDLGVVVESDLDRDQTRVVFRVNDDVVQTSDRLVYTFDAASAAPGAYIVRAELWDLQNNTIASTPTEQRVIAQQRITLGLTEGRDANALQGAVEFIAATQSDFPLPQASFTVAPAADPENTQPLGQVAFRADGTAVLALDDIRAAVQRVLPNTEPGDILILNAVVPGVATGDAPLAVADQTLRFAYSVPVNAAPPPRPLTPPERVISFVQRTDMYWYAAALVIANLILVMMTRRERIRRMILTPDKIDLSPQLMTITVLRDGVRQSHTLTKKTLMLGRGTSNDINLGDSPDISRQHGVVMWRRGEWWFTNRKAGVVSEVEGRKRRGLHLTLLEPVTEMRMGEVIVLFHSNAQQDISEFIKTDL